MIPVAVFGIENDGLNLTVNLLLLFLVVVWLALVYWTYADARRRIIDPMLVGCATAASLFPFVGTVIYLIVRPPETLEDRHERELEVAAAESRLAGAEQLACPHCGFEIERTFLRCPSCLRRLKEPCAVCGKPLDPRWKICPYCEAEVGQAEQRPRRRAAPQRQPAGGGRPAQPRRAPQPGQRPPARQGGRPTDGGPAAEPPAPAPARSARPAERQGRPPAERPPRPPGERPARPSGERPARPSGERPGP